MRKIQPYTWVWIIIDCQFIQSIETTIVFCYAAGVLFVSLKMLVEQRETWMIWFWDKMFQAERTTSEKALEVRLTLIRGCYWGSWLDYSLANVPHLLSVQNYSKILCSLTWMRLLLLCHGLGNYAISSAIVSNGKRPDKT